MGTAGDLSAGRGSFTKNAMRLTVLKNWEDEPFRTDDTRLDTAVRYAVDFVAANNRDMKKLQRQS